MKNTPARRRFKWLAKQCFDVRLKRIWARENGYCLRCLFRKAHIGLRCLECRQKRKQDRIDAIASDRCSQCFKRPKRAERATCAHCAAVNSRREIRKRGIA
jgi:hypothetical protein